MSVLGNSQGNNGGRLFSFANQPVLVDCNFVVDSSNGNGRGVRNLKGQGVQNVYMHTSATPVAGNPNPAVGYAVVQLSANYNRYLGGFSGFASPTTGSTIQINSGTAGLTVGNPYIIATPGVGPSGQATIAPVADVSGSLASKYFSLFDSYGNNFIIWFNVSGVGSQPQLGQAAAFGQRGMQYIQQSISSGATAAQIGAALVLTIQNLPSGINGVMSFTASGTTTVTVVSTATRVLAGIPQDGVSPLATGFTFALTVNDTNRSDWNTVGLPRGLAPAVGQSFIALATGAGGSTGTVIAPGISGVNSVEIIGDPNASIAPMPQGGSPNVGGWFMVQFLGPTNSSTTTQIPKAPANGTVVGLSFWVDAKFSPSNVTGV